MLKPEVGENDIATAKASLHKDKNRFSTVVPLEKQLIHFEADDAGNSPYINAVFVEVGRAHARVRTLLMVHIVLGTERLHVRVAIRNQNRVRM